MKLILNTCLLLFIFQVSEILTKDTLKESFSNNSCSV